jgi:proteasome lid subunit RPN8/RPN11
MSDREVIAALVAMRNDGLEMVGIVHSHPSGEPTLSQIDLAEAFYRNTPMVIVGFATTRPEMRAFVVDPGNPPKSRAIRFDLFS